MLPIFTNFSWKYRKCLPSAPAVKKINFKNLRWRMAVALKRSSMHHQRYRNFFYFQDGGLDFGIEIFISHALQRCIPHHHARLFGDQAHCCRDVTIFFAFLWWNVNIHQRCVNYSLEFLVIGEILSENLKWVKQILTHTHSLINNIVVCQYCCVIILTMSQN